MGDYICYCLVNPAPTTRTYIGMTNNPVRRIRQHNGEIKGGARYTSRRDGGWRYQWQVTGFESKHCALSFEWHWKRRSGRRRHGQKGTPLQRRETAARTLIAEHPKFRDRGLTLVRVATPPPPPTEEGEDQPLVTE